MKVHPHVDQVQEQLRAAAALGDERTKQIADALATAAAPAVRLAVLNALTSAADEISTALLDFPGTPVVTVRLDGDEAVVDVHAAATPTVEADEPRRDEGEPNARISLRLAETLKADIDAAAEREGVSVNTWLVRAASAALEPNPFSTWMNAGFGPGGGRGPQRRGNQHRVTGWING
jgi:predicted HicB family RNase H-like nuclease